MKRLAFLVLLFALRAQAAAPSDPFPVSRVDWLAMKVTLRFLTMSDVKLAGTCWGKDAVVACPVPGATDKDKDKTKKILQIVFDEEVKLVGLEGKAKLQFF